MRIDVNAVLLQYFEQTAPPQTRAEAVLLAAAEALRTLLGAPEEVRFVVRLGTLLKELTFPGQITRARTENEDDMILACLAHCAGQALFAFVRRTAARREIGCFRFRRRTARYTALLCAAYWEFRRMRLWPEPSA